MYLYNADATVLKNAKKNLLEDEIYVSPGRLLLQLTILTLSAVTPAWLSSLNETSLIRNVQTSSQNR